MSVDTAEDTVTQDAATLADPGGGMQTDDKGITTIDPMEGMAEAEKNAANQMPSWMTDLSERVGHEIPEKFRSAADEKSLLMEVLKSHAGQDKLLGVRGKDAPTPGDADAALGAAAEVAVLDGLDSLLEKAGLKSDTLAESWKADGKLSDEQYAALKGAGVGPEFVNQHLAGLQAIAELQGIRAQQVADVTYKHAGGAQAYKTLIGWAAANPDKSGMDAAGVAEFNASVDGDKATPVTAEKAVRLLLSRYKDAIGSANSTTRLNGDSTVAGGGVAGYTSYDEMMAAASRAGNSPEAQAEYDKRFAASNGPWQ